VRDREIAPNKIIGTRTSVPAKVYAYAPSTVNVHRRLVDWIGTGLECFISRVWSSWDRQYSLKLSVIKTDFSVIRRNSVIKSSGLIGTRIMISDFDGLTK